MPDQTLITDTKEKMIMKDHDILITLLEKVNDFTRRYDEDRRADAEAEKALALELKGVSIQQVRIETQITNLEKEHGEFDRRLDRLENKSINMDVISYLMAIIAGLIAWFK